MTIKHNFCEALKSSIELYRYSLSDDKNVSVSSIVGLTCIVKNKNAVFLLSVKHNFLKERL